MGDKDMDGVVDGFGGNAEAYAAEKASVYAEQLATQLRKGFLAYCVLKICSQEAQENNMAVVTLYRRFELS